MDRQAMKITDIARMAGVSPTAVSAVINHRRGTIRLSEATRQRIERVLLESGYRPNAVGKGLVVGKSFLIGVVVGNVSNSFTPLAIQGIEDVAAAKGYGVLLMTSRGEVGREHRVLQFMQQRGVDGLMISPSGVGMDDQTREVIVAIGVPTLRIFSQPIGVDRNDRYVCVDSERVSFLAMAHLIARGHRHIAGVGMYARYPQGAAKAIRAGGMRVKLETWDADGQDDRAGQIVQRWRESSVRPTALFVGAGDELACDVMHRAIRSGIRVPQELAIVGVDDIAHAAKAVVPLTTVSQPKYEQGCVAAEMVFEMIEGKECKSRELEPELIVRESA